MRTYYFFTSTLFVIASCIIAISVTIICKKIRRSELTTIAIGMWLYVIGYSIYYSRTLIRFVDYSYYREIKPLFKPYFIIGSGLKTLGLIVVAGSIIWLYKSFNDRAQYSMSSIKNISPVATANVDNIDKPKIEHNELNSRVNKFTLKSLFSFEGRIGRSTFWAVIVPLFLISIGLQVGAAVSTDRGGSGGIVVLTLIYFIPAIWVALATYVKRWHDLNMSGWMVLTLFIPFINFLILLYLGLAPGKTETNKYGEVPQ